MKILKITLPKEKGNILTISFVLLLSTEKKCDGIVHCIEGEDEADETCEGLIYFPPEATIECIENRLGYNITIKATPCDGVKECRDGSDEKCEEDNSVLVGIVAGLVIITALVYHYLKWYKLGWNDKIITERTFDDFGSCCDLWGDSLARLKVRLIKTLKDYPIPNQLFILE